MAMGRSKWENTLACFQACARGYLVRNEVRRAREDFEDIVKEIDGGLTHVEWTQVVIPTPRFTDTGGPFLRPSSSARRSADPGPSPQIPPSPSPPSPSPPSPSPPPSLPERDHSVLQEKIEAERDAPLTKGQTCLSEDVHSSSVGETQKESTVVEKDGESTTVWSSLDLDMDNGPPHKGFRQYCLAREVPRTPEALRLHRNTLTMELVWLQQAIDSRKKYLSLKDSLSVS